MSGLIGRYRQLPSVELMAALQAEDPSVLEGGSCPGGIPRKVPTDVPMPRIACAFARMSDFNAARDAHVYPKLWKVIRSTQSPDI